MDKEQIEGHVRLKLIAVFAPFDGYGLRVFVPEAINACIELMKWYEQQLHPTGPIEYGWKRSKPE